MISAEAHRLGFDRDRDVSRREHHLGLEKVRSSVVRNDSYLKLALRADWLDVDLAARGKWSRLAGVVQRNGRRAGTEMVEFETGKQRMIEVAWGMQGRERYSQALIAVKKAWRLKGRGKQPKLWRGGSRSRKELQAADSTGARDTVQVLGW